MQSVSVDFVVGTVCVFFSSFRSFLADFKIFHFSSFGRLLPDFFSGRLAFSMLIRFFMFSQMSGLSIGWRDWDFISMFDTSCLIR